LLLLRLKYSNSPSTDINKINTERVLLFASEESEQFENIYWEIAKDKYKMIN